MLQDDKAITGALRGGARHRLFEPHVVVRWIEHDDVERAARNGLGERARRDVADDNTAIRLAAERGVGGDQRRGPPIALDACRAGRSPTGTSSRSARPTRNPTPVPSEPMDLVNLQTRLLTK